MAETVAFYLFAIVTIGGAIGAVQAKELVHAALFLTVSFIGVACLYFQLDADYLGAAQLMVYAGGVAILIVLGVMLTRHRPGEDTSPGNAHRLAASLVGLLFFLVVCFAASAGILPDSATPPAVDTVSALADLMLGDYRLSFEMAATLLLAALVGVVVLAKEEG